jgi:hypothetical protein
MALETMPMNREPRAVSHAAKIAERLLAHARLCRHIAEQAWSEETAHKLGTLADECTRAAAELLPGELLPDDHDGTRH